MPSLRSAGLARLAPLTHPGWWAALGILVLNDHVLKHAGLLPGALTGKLSDFAGLIVAPVLVGALFGARTDRARAVAFAACAIPFSAINLSPALAAGWDALLGWSTTPDPTDLVALVVAPLALRLGRAEAPASRVPLARASAILGGLACIATAQPRDVIVSTDGGPTLTNGTRGEVALRVRWIDAALDCEKLLSWTAEGWGAGELERAFDPALFDVARTYRLQPGEIADLTRPEGPAPEGRCDALVVSADGLGQRLVVYPLTVRSWTGADELHLGERRDGLILSSPTLWVLDPQPSVSPPSCDRGAEVGAFSWTGSAPRVAMVVGYEPISASCFELMVAEPTETAPHIDGDSAEPWEPPVPAPPLVAAEIHRLTFCAPRELFAFTVGERVEVVYSEGRIRVEGVTHGVTLEALTRLDAGDERALCEGERLPCGGYVEPVAWQWGGGRLLPGEARVRDSGTGRTTWLLGDARRVVVAHESCALETGLRGALLTSWESYR